MMPPRSLVVLGIVLLCSACPEDEKNLPVLTATGAGSLPGGSPDDAGAVSDATATATDSGSDAGTASGTDTEAATGTAGDGTVGDGTVGGGTSDGSGTFGGSDTIDGTVSIGEPPPITTGPLTTG